MRDLELRLVDEPGRLGVAATVLGTAGVSLEGGRVFVVGGVGVGHYLVADDDVPAATSALREAGVELVAVHDVVLTRLRQEVPGELGAVTTRLGAAGVGVVVQYSDHDGQLVLVVDDPATAVAVLRVTDGRGQTEPGT